MYRPSALRRSSPFPGSCRLASFRACSMSAAVPAARFVALDNRHVGDMHWTFDAVVVLWNSFGFGSRTDDVAVLEGLYRVLRPGGKLLLDLYHPGWLALHEQVGFIDSRGAEIDRWIRGGRCCQRSGIRTVPRTTSSSTCTIRTRRSV